MRRIDVATAVASPPPVPSAGTAGYFTNGNPGAGVPATEVPDWWLNMTQGEIEAVILAAGLTPTKDVWNQLRDALAILYGGTGVFAATGHLWLPGRVLMQWGQYAGTTGSLVGGVAEIAGITVTFPIAFPTECWRVYGFPHDVTGAALQEHAWGGGTPSTTAASMGLSCRQASTAMSASYFAIGR